MVSHAPARHRILMLLVLVLVGINMRPLLTSVGPLLPELRRATGMSFVTASLLTALPVVAMGVMALAGSWVNGLLSQRAGVALSLAMIILGALAREMAPNSAMLLTSALLGGIGIGVIQTIMPALIKHLFQRHMPPVMGLWSAALMGGGGLGAALTPWIAGHSGTALWHGGRCLPPWPCWGGGIKAVTLPNLPAAAARRRSASPGIRVPGRSASISAPLTAATPASLRGFRPTIFSSAARPSTAAACWH